MEVRALTQSDIEAWIDMRQRLWPDHDREELVGETVDWVHGRLGVFVAETTDSVIGFAEVTMRDHADGCSTSPVGYLEGWWVDPDHRRKGIGSALLAASEQWARDHGATEFASDAHADNEASRLAHAAAGFVEKRAVVRFHKQIAVGAKDAATIAGEATVTLREITGENVRAVTRLDVAPFQKAFVAPNAVSLAQFAVAENAWTRAVYADDTAVGYVLLAVDEGDAYPYYLWRFMIDRRYQGRGFGEAAMELVIGHVRGRPRAKGLATSYVPLTGGPGEFYHRLGFVDTGEEDGGEILTYLAF
ncbi:MAG: GNAT family N-acetyltransferase [Actinomycetota bacterium]|nr:GNAT family N-acetyltransferase [Actinomycetota bacterium]